MQVAMVTDTHLGVHKSSDVFLKSQLNFFRNQFIPELKKKKIDTIIHLGDMFDNRSNMNVKVMNEVHKLFKEDFKDFKIYIICGNHDIFYRDTVEVNSLKFLNELPNVTVIEEITKINIANRDLLLVPWQTDKKDFIKRVSDKNIDCDVCCGHFEIAGVPMNKGKVCDTGIGSELFFNNYTLTFSGHFHKRSVVKRNNNIIQYIGNAYHLTRHDIGEERGYCILDLETLTYEFILNTLSLNYVKRTYPEKIIKKEIEGNIVDVHVNIDKDYDEKKFQKYLSKIEDLNPVIPPIVKIEHDFNITNTNNYKVQSVTELINEYVNDLDINDKKDITEKILKLYDEAKNEI